LGLLDAAKLTVPKAAKALGIGETKLREIIRNGEVPVLNVAGKILLLDRDLEAYMRSGYGDLRPARKSTDRIAALPKCVRDSKLLNKAG
jgi:excisionase family DNA binding protein